VPIEYGRGVEDGKATLDFEIQEAITFRDGAAQAFGDLEPALGENAPREVERRLRRRLDRLGRGDMLSQSSRTPR
jgi:high-affinity iron transporter